MLEPHSDFAYPVLVSQREGAFELTICELLLTVHSTDLVTAYNELRDQQREVLAWVAAVGVLHELPPPRPPPLIDGDKVERRFRRAPAAIRNL